MITAYLLETHGFTPYRHTEQVGEDLAVGITLWRHPMNPKMAMFFYRPAHKIHFWVAVDKAKAQKTCITNGIHIETGERLHYSEVTTVGNFFTKKPS